MRDVNIFLSDYTQDGYVAVGGIGQPSTLRPIARSGIREVSDIQTKIPEPP